MQRVIAPATPFHLRPVFLLCVFVPALGILAWADFDALQSARLSGNSAPSVTLGLVSEQFGAEWKLAWNPSAAPLAGAAAAELLIEDGNHENRILLSPAQIRSGSVLYSPFTPDICFSLRAFDGERRSVSETLRALDWQPSYDTAGSPETGYAERSMPRRHVVTRTPHAPGTVIVRATTLRGASAGDPTLAARRTGWPYRLLRSGSKLEITETAH